MRIGSIAVRRESCSRCVSGALGLALVALGAVGIVLSQKNRLRLGLGSGAVAAGAGLFLAGICRPHRARAARQTGLLEREEDHYQARASIAGERGAAGDLKGAAERMADHYMGPQGAATPDTAIAKQVSARCALLKDAALLKTGQHNVALRALDVIAQRLSDSRGGGGQQTVQRSEERPVQAVLDEIGVMDAVLADSSWQSNADLTETIRSRAIIFAAVNGAKQSLGDETGMARRLAKWSRNGDSLFSGSVIGAINDQLSEDLGDSEVASRYRTLLQGWIKFLPAGDMRTAVEWELRGINDVLNKRVQ
jgi:hypothetical protein